MKILLKLVVIIATIGASQISFAQNSSSNGMLKAPKEALYKVYKIDSIKNFYLIYASRKDTLYKIVSKKSPLGDCSPIKVNQKYPFILRSRLAERLTGKIKILPGLVNCFSYGDDTVICFEGDSINDLHSADNIRGLCFFKDDKLPNLTKKNY